MNTEANRPAVIGYVILYCKLCKGFEFLYVKRELCTKYPKLRVLSPRDRVKSWDENSIQEMKKRIKLVFSPKLVCTVVSSPDLDLPSTRLHCCCSCCSSNQKSCQKNSCKSCELIPSFIKQYLILLTLQLHSNWG
jgi:hypothetical protein